MLLTRSRANFTAVREGNRRAGMRRSLAGMMNYRMCAFFSAAGQRYKRLIQALKHIWQSKSAKAIVS